MVEIGLSGEDVILQESGVLNFGNVASYVGDVENKEMRGKGVLTSADGDRYEGKFRDGKKYYNPWTHPAVTIVAITSFLVTICALKTIFPERNPQPNPADGETFYPQEEMEKAVRHFARNISSSGTFDPVGS
jgi:hypothetical protein